MCRKPQTPAPKKATVEQPSDQSSAALFGWLRRPCQTMTKAKLIIRKKGTASNIEKIVPVHCQ